MKFEKAAAYLADIPMTKPYAGRRLYDFVRERRPERILELGFAHGVSTCYMAAALDDLGRGHITTMDREQSRRRDPDIDTNLATLGLERYVTPVWAARSFTWELGKLIAAHPEPLFDFVYYDGGNSWDVAGYAFFLADRLLRPGGWMLFDNLTWTHESASARGAGARAMSDEERRAAQVGMVFDLLVRRHPDYTDFHVTSNGKWGWARKRSADEEPTRPPSPADISRKLVRRLLGSAPERLRAVRQLQDRAARRAAGRRMRAADGLA